MPPVRRWHPSVRWGSPWIRSQADRAAEALDGSIVPTAFRREFSGSGEGIHHASRQRQGTQVDGRAVDHAARRAAPSARPHWHQEGLRPRPVRRLHGPGRRPADQFVPHARGHEGWRADHDHRRFGAGRRAPPVATGLHRSRRVPVRLLHPRPNLLGRRPDRRRPRAHRRRDPRADERQSLPLRRVYPHRRGDRAGARRQERGAAAVNNFAYTRAHDVAEAVRAIAADPGAKFIAGGTNLIDLMKENVARPSRLIDISRLPLDKIEDTGDGGLRIGALVPNSDLAYHPQVETRYPLLGSAILAGASAQLRNMASTGGNLLQRTRCMYFYDVTTPCNKRAPGSGCSAIDGINRMHAILGASTHCIATHPSDMCVALAALEARVLAAGRAGGRRIGFAEFHRLPGDAPDVDSNLRADEIITAIELPPKGFAKHYTYLKVRDRLSYAFALVSVAVGLDIDGGTIKEARLALGGGAPKL